MAVAGKVLKSSSRALDDWLRADAVQNRARAEIGISTGGQFPVVEQRPLKGATEVCCSGESIVDDQTAVDYKRNAYWCTTPLSAGRVQRQVEDGNIERGRLSCAGRQVQHLRPHAWLPNLTAAVATSREPL
jgi:hypothetical protein